MTKLRGILYFPNDFLNLGFLLRSNTMVAKLVPNISGHFPEFSFYFALNLGKDIHYACCKAVENKTYIDVCFVFNCVAAPAARAQCHFTFTV